MEAAMDLRLKRDAFYYEALRICDERGFDAESVPNIAMGLRHQAFMRAIQPILKAQARVMGLDLQPMTIGADGFARPAVLSEEQRKTLSLTSDLLISVAQQYGLDWCPLP